MAVVYQPTFSNIDETKDEEKTSIVGIFHRLQALKKSEDDEKSLDKVSAEEKTLMNLVVPDEETLKILPDKRKTCTGASDSVKDVEIVESSMRTMSGMRVPFLGCCKVETENGYSVKEAHSGRQLLLVKENSSWFARNPCFGLCDCNCCCFCACSSRRPFTLTLTEGEGTPMMLEMSRPAASDCLPCCLQRITVKDQSSTLGSVVQVLDNMCGNFEVHDLEGNAQFVIEVPCLLTTCWCNQADFLITNLNSEEVGRISKTSSNVGKEFFTDGDRFVINFPANCLPEMKATILGAAFLFDFMFYED